MNRAEMAQIVMETLPFLPAMNEEGLKYTHMLKKLQSRPVTSDD